MKKYLLIILLIMLTISLVGCFAFGNDPETTAPVISDPTTFPSTSTTAPSSIQDPDNQFTGPLIAVSMPLVTEKIQASTGNTILFYNRFQNVSLNIDTPEANQRITLDLLNRLDAMSSVKSDVYESAKQDYKEQPYWYPYRTSIIYEPARLDSNLLSMIGTEEIFDGTPRSATVKRSVTYDLISGETITLKSILLEDFSADSLSELIIEGLSSYTSDSLFGDYKEIIHDMFNTNVPVDSWYFSETGLVFFFNPYEIAPHSLGTVYSEIPYERLLGVVREAFFPTEKDQYTGNIQVSTTDISSGTSLDQFSRIAELNLSDSKQQVIISCEGSVTDLRIYMGTMGSNGLSFTTDAIIFSATGLSSDDAIVIHADTATVTEYLAVSYVSQGQTVFQTFALNKDGALTLSES